MSKQLKVPALIIHLLLWAGYGLVVFYLMSFPFESQYAWALSARVVFVHALLFYLNTEIILPKLLERGKYGVYVFGLLTLIIGVYYFFNFTSEVGIFREALDSIRPRRQFQGPRPIFSRWMISNMLSSTAILFISTTYWLINRERRRKQQELSLINENLQSEMKFLKSQINPHFLFNALNNIYSLMRSNSQNAQQMILKLSEMLRYVIYDSNEKKVPLVKEIDYIINFIGFQKLKYEEEVNITADFQNVDGSLYVEPMLFIPFIENSFKHSRVEDDKNSRIDLKIQTSGNKILFILKNSFPPTEFSKDATRGIGIQNVKKRLELLYPGKYVLNIEETEKEFSVSLEIET
jgi:hypothetical protein